MRPINFNYAISRKQKVRFPILDYDHELNLNKVNNKIFVRFSQEKKSEKNNLLYMTKTEVERERDDEPRLELDMYQKLTLMTKTDAKPELDDD